MFTGIVTAIGSVARVEQRGDLRLTITGPLDPATIDIGASIACSGVCLTVVDRGGSKGEAHFTVDVSAETTSRTAARMWEEGAHLNLEPSLRLGDELGGHIVTGHVDAVGTIAKSEAEGDSTRLTIAAPAELAPFIAAKGSITVNGVSLTVNSVEDQPDGEVLFGLNIIPHTAQVTTLGQLGEGDELNLEVDTIARYLHRMQALRAS
ncbi:riboflavin synthase [Aurantiacibacter gangjinensis]|uniref:Riboflavin synthase n=1 Tax=Aurantiacibacter gangjinensis TaxID=502682 RepID=A0A0G9MMM6_9SPHN|nr:riboflavin synthase [Aurantiacibacter gangjinensis]APE27904.1 Riboflavin synthase eubacterial/eukaryotic [Aurantiacibacter gangjinensis]KLE31864.1 riboflavin synthase subunit alpha [Aurantiacibacter gangjinensis]